MIHSQKHGDGDVMPEPVNRQAIPSLPMEYQQTSVGQRFLLFDSGVDDHDRIFVFGTDQALQLLANSDDWFGEGTFTVCPEVFFQLYTVHVKLAGRALPCIYVLLPNKQGFTYTQLFRHVLAAIEPLGNGPSTMVFDFEKAAINAAENVFENVEVSCCFFHLSSNIWKQIKFARALKTLSLHYTCVWSLHWYLYPTGCYR